MAKNGYKVIDCDIHVEEPADLWERYMEPAYKEHRPKREETTLETIGTDLEVWHFAGKVFPAYLDDPGRRRFAEVRRTKSDERHRATGRYKRKEDDLRGDDPHSMLKAMDVEGIDVSIVFRTYAAHLIAVDGIDPKLSAAVCRAFNNWLGGVL